MGKGINRIVAGAIGGVVGGALMSLALYGTRRAVQNVPALQVAFPKADEQEMSNLGRDIASSAAVGGLYGAIRAALHVPAVLFGPLYGLATYGLERAGLGPAIAQTEGPWNDESLGVAPRIIARVVYGTVAGWVAGLIEGLL